MFIRPLFCQTECVEDSLLHLKKHTEKLLLHGRPATCCKHLYVSYGRYPKKG